MITPPSTPSDQASKFLPAMFIVLIMTGTTVLTKGRENGGEHFEEYIIGGFIAIAVIFFVFMAVGL